MAYCGRFPSYTNETLGTELGQILHSVFDLNVSSNLIAQPIFLSNVFCSADTAQTCFGICPNADLAGVGVRTAFWLSSILQAILVFKSPEESSQGAWTAVVLTASVTVPAFFQKRQRQLSVYHATLVLNFATFSSIVSLAVAPMCSVWREHPEGDDNVLYEEGEEPDEHDSLSNLPRHKVHRQRLMLSLALLTQIALQWAWVIMLFTDPEYAQKACIPSTIVVLFGKPFTTGAVNHTSYAVWLCWLLFNLIVTLVWGVLLVMNSAESVHPVLSRQPSRTEYPCYLKDATTRTSWSKCFPVDRGRILVVAGNCTAFCISLLFLVSSEVQVGQNKNCVLGGENTDWSFGQVAALLVSLTPSWSIFNAFARKRQIMASSSSTSDLEADSSGTAVGVQSSVDSSFSTSITDTDLPT